MLTSVTRVRDIMQREVVTACPDDTICELIERLTSRGISGVPVVDRGGQVLGVVSASDVLRLAAAAPGESEGRQGLPDRAMDRDTACRDPRCARLDYFIAMDSELRWKEVDPGALSRSVLAHTRISEIMTPAIFRVRAEATIPELARFLSRAGIHRALVMRRGRLAGLVTTMDVVRALAENGGAATDGRAGPAAVRVSGARKT